MYTKARFKCFMKKYERMEEREFENIKELLLQYITGTIEEEGLEILNRWRQESVLHEEIFQRLISKDFLSQNRKKCILSPQEAQKEWKQISRRTFHKKPVRWQRIVRYAAVFLLPLCLSLFLLKREQPVPEMPVFVQDIKEIRATAPVLTLSDGSSIQLETGATEKIKSSHSSILRTGDTLCYVPIETPDTALHYNTLTIPKGSDYHLMLSDGTVVYLNTSSSLRYPVRFNGKIREVELIGEGYFQVRRDTACPFVVKANGVAVKVLGTSFNVRAYQDERFVSTTLVEGAVHVKNQQSGVVLSPSQQAVCTSESRGIDVQTVNADYYIGWVSGRFIFNNTRLDDILTRLQEWYNFEVFYEKENLKALPFSLNIDKHKDFSAILNALERTECVRFSINGRTVVVKNY